MTTKKIKIKIDEARKIETDTGKPQYVIVCFDGEIVIEDSMPMLGEWYTADGIRHG